MIFTLSLDENRQISIDCPISVTPEELERIQQWISFQLIIDMPKSRFSKDRQTHGGKGDAPRRGGESAYRDALYWKRTPCCNVRYKLDELGYTTCSRCGRLQASE